MATDQAGTRGDRTDATDNAEEMGDASDLDLELNGDRLREEWACSVSTGTRRRRHWRSRPARCSTAPEAAGIVSHDGRRAHSERRPRGRRHLSRREPIDRPPGSMAIGHVRYSTTGETVLRNVQPFSELTAGVRGRPQRQPHQRPDAARQLVRDGAIMQSTTDTEVILHLLARSGRVRFIDRFIERRASSKAFLAGGAHQQEAVGARSAWHQAAGAGRAGRPPDRHSRPARRHHRAHYVRDVDNGDRRASRKAQSLAVPADAAAALHSSTSISHGRLVVGGRSVYQIRRNMGIELAGGARGSRRGGAVPDSGVPAAIGYAQAAGIPYELGIIRNHYVGRTFIQPTQSIRELGVRPGTMPTAPWSPEAHRADDDSLVRGNVDEDRANDARSGAKEVHFRIALADHASDLRHRYA
jgi:amidophosphoribosyltransferase